MIKTVKLTNGKRVPLREHQQEAIEKLTAHYRAGKARASIFHCCRSGKSLTSVGVHKELGSNATVVFSPNLNLVKQTLEDWKPNCPKAHILVVAGDKSVYEGEVTTSPKKIKQFIKENKGKKIVIFSTYHSSKRICEAVSELEDFSFDFMVADEAHRSAGVNLKNARFLHFDDCIKAVKRLYMTATPRYISQRVMEYAHSDAEKVCMSDKDIFGEELHTFSFLEGIEEAGVLADYHILGQGISCPLTKRAIEDDTNPNHSDILETVKLECLIKVLKEWGEDEGFSLSHCISFHGTIDKALMFAEKFKLKGWKTFHINSLMNAEERAKILKAFRKAKKALLTNCKCLSEGVNIVECDSVFFSDTKGSAIDVVQSASRPLTIDSNKPKGFKSLIIIPTLHGVDDGVNDILARHSHQTMLAVVKHMREHDGRIEAQIDSLRKGAPVDPKDPSNIIIMDGFENLTEKIFLTLIPTNRGGITDEEITECWIKHKGKRTRIALELRVREATLKQWLSHSRPNLKKMIPRKYWDKGRLHISREECIRALKEAKGLRAKACKLVKCGKTGRVGVSASQMTNLVRQHDLESHCKERYNGSRRKTANLTKSQVLERVEELEKGGILGLAKSFGIGKPLLYDKLAELGILEEVNEKFGVFSDARIFHFVKEAKGIMNDATQAMGVSKGTVKRRRSMSAWLDEKVRAYLVEEYGDENYNPSRALSGKESRAQLGLVEDEEIVNAFYKHNGDVGKSAEELDMSVDAMYNWISQVQRPNLKKLMPKKFWDNIRKEFPRSKFGLK